MLSPASWLGSDAVEELLDQADDSCGDRLEGAAAPRCGEQYASDEQRENWACRRRTEVSKVESGVSASRIDRMNVAKEM